MDYAAPPEDLAPRVAAYAEATGRAWTASGARGAPPAEFEAHAATAAGALEGFLRVCAPSTAAGAGWRRRRHFEAVRALRALPLEFDTPSLRDAMRRSAARVAEDSPGGRRGDDAGFVLPLLAPRGDPFDRASGGGGTLTAAAYDFLGPVDGALRRGLDRSQREGAWALLDSRPEDPQASKRVRVPRGAPVPFGRRDAARPDEAVVRGSDLAVIRDCYLRRTVERAGDAPPRGGGPGTPSPAAVHETAKFLASLAPQRDTPAVDGDESGDVDATIREPRDAEDLAALLLALRPRLRDVAVTVAGRALRPPLGAVAARSVRVVLGDPPADYDCMEGLREGMEASARAHGATEWMLAVAEWPRRGDPRGLEALRLAAFAPADPRPGQMNLEIGCDAPLPDPDGYFAALGMFPYVPEGPGLDGLHYAGPWEGEGDEAVRTTAWYDPVDDEHVGYISFER